MTSTVIFMMVGVGLGLSCAYVIRRYQAAAKARKPLPPPVFTSRQDQRRYERELSKRQDSERKLQDRRDKASLKDE